LEHGLPTIDREWSLQGTQKNDSLNKIVAVDEKERIIKIHRELPEEVEGLQLIPMTEELERLLPADLVVVNPPRTGLDPDVPAILSANSVERVIYVSCDPATLARDLDRMRETHQLQDIRAFDLFPQTSHVETVVALSRTGAVSTPPENQGE
jgi:tRNA/tmRNA/rRNA uracil-C5-methylase (TrmA/RlmC/RlmD family)